MKSETLLLLALALFILNKQKSKPHYPPQCPNCGTGNTANNQVEQTTSQQIKLGVI